MLTRLVAFYLFCIWFIQISHQTPERCKLPPESGQCMARIPRLFYNVSANSCAEFFYGGCGGNENNFETLDDCHSVCVTETKTIASGDRCALRPEVGNCKASHPRLYYDPDTNTCKDFTYGGCGGNDNNFETTEECQRACVKNTSGDSSRCLLKPEVGTCKARMPRLYYDIGSNTCKEFIYGGCGGNANNFESLQECDQACVSLARYGGNRCYQEMVVGSCKGVFPRIYFDYRSGACKEFIYGGCDGNDNNFENYTECANACIKTTPGNVCELAQDTGNCRGMFFRYYYDSKTKTCGQFIYGGCGGNENNFETLQECQKRCGVETPQKEEEGCGFDCGNEATSLSLSKLVISITCLSMLLARY